MVSMIDREEEFSFHTYIQTPAGVTPLVLYKERDGQIRLSLWDNLETLAEAIVAIVTPGLLSFRLEISEGVALCRPQGVLRQLSYD